MKIRSKKYQKLSKNDRIKTNENEGNMKIGKITANFLFGCFPENLWGQFTSMLLLIIVSIVLISFGLFFIWIFVPSRDCKGRYSQRFLKEECAVSAYLWGVVMSYFTNKFGNPYYLENLIISELAPYKPIIQMKKTKYEELNGIFFERDISINKNCDSCESLLFVTDLHLNSIHYLEAGESYIDGLVSKIVHTLDEKNEWGESIKVNDRSSLYIVFLGDIVDYGTKCDYYLGQLLFLKLWMEGFRYFGVTPGNHDLLSFYGNFKIGKQMSLNYANMILNCTVENGVFFNDYGHVEWKKRYFPKIISFPGNVDLVLLDSNTDRIFFHNHGEIEVSQRVLLEEYFQSLESHENKTTVKRESEVEVIIGMHHHPLLGIKSFNNYNILNWIIEIFMFHFGIEITRLLDCVEFTRILGKYQKHVSIVLFGHLHNYLSAEFDGIHYKGISSIESSKHARFTYHYRVI